MSVEQKILTLRKRIKELNLKATGYNSHAKYNYYQLSDFLPHTIDICSELGLYDEYSEDGEYKTLTIVDVEKPTDIRLYQIKKTEIPPVLPNQPTEKVGSAMQKVGNNAQAVGSVDTYFMRYLYRNLLKLTEPDFTEIMAERNALIQAIQQNLPPQHIQSILSKKNKFRLDDFTNEELREVWQWILNQRQAQQQEQKQQEQVEGEQTNDK
nr:MAG TPA: ERF superfamily protein [Caudoviricetes sp.]